MSNSHNDKKTLDHILKYTGVFGGVQGLVMAMSIIRNKLTSKILGTVGYGLMSQYATIIDSIHSTTNLGIPFSTVRRVSELFEQGDEDAITHFVCVVRTWCLWVSMLGMLLCLCGAPFMANIFFPGESVGLISIMGLSPILLFMGITAGEVSILKGMRRLKRVASITALGAFTTLLITVPTYWLLGIPGIVLALNLSTAAITIIHLSLTLPLYPWNVKLFSKEIFREGLPMIRIGIPFILAAIAGSIAAICLKAFLKRHGSDELVGLYSVGFTIMATYAGMVFAAFESDYFPRLSSVNHDPAQRNVLINQQIHVSVLLVAPLLIAMILMMPIMLKLLYTDNFLPTTSMAVCAAFYSFFQAVCTPMSYTALARGDSHIYLAMEIIYDVVSVLIICYCFQQWGLIGAGIGLSCSTFFDVLLIGFTYGHIYKIRFTHSTFMLIAAQFVFLGCAVATCLVTEGLTKYAIGGSLFFASVCYSYHILSIETDVIPRIKNKLHL